MDAPFPAGPRRATNGIVVEVSPDQIPPTLPFELRDHVSPNTWEARVSALVRLASHYSRPGLERAYLFFMLGLTFLVPIATYYVALQALTNATGNLEQDVWFARFSCFGAVLATWVILTAPWVAWKYIGKTRVRRLADQWTRSDGLAAPAYGEAPVWRASPPGLFRDAIMLMVTIPLTKKSQFDRDSSLPPYVSAGEDALPPYADSKMAGWSKDAQGGVKYGDIPIYSDKTMA